MKSSQRSALRWLHATIFLSLGIAPFVACAGTVKIDCSQASPQADGLVACGPAMTRPEAVTCSAPAPGTGTMCADYSECLADTDCTGDLGRCNDDSGYGYCTCGTSCTVDADCPSGMACLCEEAGGRCVPANCATDADCAAGQSCVLYQQIDPCGGTSTPAFACSTGNDECLADSQCSDGKACEFSGDSFNCYDNACYEGRPFFVEDELRVASVVRSADWPCELLPDTESLAPDERKAHAARWTRIGLLEHASVASFARFSLQLMSLGAPPELIEETTRAMADETLHARLAFGLASAYEGAKVGPGDLDIGSALGRNDIESIVRTLIQEGCVGETFAAALAREERARTSDPVVLRVLDRIAADEERHAVLAWRALSWLVGHHCRAAEVAQTLAAEIRALTAEVANAHNMYSNPEAPPVRGVLSEREMATLRRDVLSAVVLPAANALLVRAHSDREPVSPIPPAHSDRADQRTTVA